MTGNSSDTNKSDQWNVLSLVRPELLSRKAYSAASPDRGSIRLHANENPWSVETGESPASAQGLSPEKIVQGVVEQRSSPSLANADNEASFQTDNDRELNRYPSPHPPTLVSAMAGYYGVSQDQVLPVRGSDDGIDLLMRAFCSAGEDSITISSPTFGMYRSSAEVQGAGIVDIPLREVHGSFELDTETLLDAGAASKLVFICTPNNPTAHSISRSTIESVCERLVGRSMLVVDEAYIEFSRHESVSGLLNTYPNLVVLRTLSKAFGAAGVRCGAVLAHSEVIGVLRSIATPYALATPVVEIATSAFEPEALALLTQRCQFLTEHAAQLSEALRDHPLVEHVYPTDANFLLVRFGNAALVYDAFKQAKVLVRDFSNATGSDGCLRISVGTEEENRAVLSVLDKLQTVSSVKG